MQLFLADTRIAVVDGFRKVLYGDGKLVGVGVFVAVINGAFLAFNIGSVVNDVSVRIEQIARFFVRVVVGKVRVVNARVGRTVGEPQTVVLLVGEQRVVHRGEAFVFGVALDNVA